MTKKKTIFLADDDLDDQGLFADALKDIDNEITLVTAVNGLEALAVAKGLQAAPDFIFLDMNMPLMNGMQCLQELKKIPAMNKVPVIIYSTSSYKKDIEKAKLAGATDYIVKPFSFSELREKIRAILDGHDGQRKSLA
jgi:CheY-like chemotaxis protein